MFAELGFGLLKELGCSRSGPECPRAPTAHKNRHPAWPPGLLVIPRPQAHASSCCPLWAFLCFCVPSPCGLHGAPSWYWAYEEAAGGNTGVHKPQLSLVWGPRTPAIQQ